MMHTEVDDNGDGPISLSDEQIVDNIIGVIFASRDTTASALTWIIKFLKSNPHLLRSIIVSFTSLYSHFILKTPRNEYKRSLHYILPCECFLILYVNLVCLISIG